jgi:ribosome-associated toxin RatA of RatAB toxin-antitoxin module
MKLRDGEVVVAVRHGDGPSKGMVEATILIDAPAEDIWQVMLDCAEIPNFVPSVKHCSVLSSGDGWEIISHDVKWAWLFPRLSYVFRADYLANRRIDFRRIDGDIRDMRGSWRLLPMPEGGQTLVCYSVFLDPGFFVPQWLVRQALKTDLAEVLAALRSRVLAERSGGQQ